MMINTLVNVPSEQLIKILTFIITAEVMLDLWAKMFGEVRVNKEWPSLDPLAKFLYVLCQHLCFE